MVPSRSANLQTSEGDISLTVEAEIKKGRKPDHSTLAVIEVYGDDIKFCLPRGARAVGEALKKLTGAVEYGR